MKGYIRIKDILEYCKEVENTHKELIDKALSKEGPIQNVSAAAYFMQQADIYRFTIPNMIKELGSEEIILDDHISTLDLPNVTYNILARKGITTIGEIAEKTITELKKIRGLGPKQLEYLLIRLNELGIKLKN